MTPITVTEQQAVSGGRAIVGPPSDPIELPLHTPSPSLPVFRPPPES